MTDKKRLTAKQVIERLNADIDEHVSTGKNDHDWIACGISHAVKAIQSNLIPRYQDEPDGDGWYWVEGYGRPRFISSSTGWKHADDEYGANQFDLISRRVCPIDERPEAGE